MRTELSGISWINREVLLAASLRPCILPTLGTFLAAFRGVKQTFIALTA
jgi:hypothetical protein